MVKHRLSDWIGRWSRSLIGISITRLSDHKEDDDTTTTSSTQRVSDLFTSNPYNKS